MLHEVMIKSSGSSKECNAAPAMTDDGASASRSLRLAGIDGFVSVVRARSLFPRRLMTNVTFLDMIE